MKFEAAKIDENWIDRTASSGRLWELCKKKVL